MAYRIETRTGGSDVKLFVNLNEAIKYYEDNIAFNVIMSELEIFEGYLYIYSESYKKYIIYSQEGKFLCRSKDLTIDCIKETIKNNIFDLDWK